MTHEPTALPASARFSGALICIGAVLSVLLMMRHPSIQTHTVAEAIAQMQDKAALNGFVHGGLLVVLTAIFVGYLGFADLLGWQKLGVRAGAVFYGCGVGCMIGAALINGFIVPALASDYAGQPDAVLETLKPIFVLCHSTNQALAQAGTLAMSIGILAWSIELSSRGMAARVIGVLGCLCAALPIVGLLSSHLRLNVHGMGLVILAQAIWSFCVGIWMIRQRARPVIAS